MTLADAFVAIAQAGGRFVVEGGSIFVDLPPGGPPVSESVLAVLTAHRETLAAALGGTPPGVARDDERDAIVWAERRPNPEADEALAKALADWAATEPVRDAKAPAAPPSMPWVLRGIPFATAADTIWYSGRREIVTIPAGTVGFTIPSVTAIADDATREGIVGTLRHMTRRGIHDGMVVWLAGKPRGLERALMRFGGVVAPAGMEPAPWAHGSPLQHREKEAADFW